MRCLLIILMIFLNNIAYASQVLVIVDRKAITSADLEKRLEALRFINPGLVESPEVKQQILNNLISEELFHNESERLKVTVNDDEIKSKFKELQQDRNYSDAFMKNLMNNKSLWTQIESQILWGKLVSAVFYNKVKVSDAEIRDEQQVRNQKIKEVDFKQLLFKMYSSEKVEKVRKEAKNCNDLDSIAMKYGFSRPYHNKVSFSDLNPDLQSLIKSLSVNQISDIVPAYDQHQIIMLCGKVTENNPQDIKEIHQELSAKKINAEAQKYLLELKKRIYIEYVSTIE